jgi:FtsZ-interacting cell division protein ZipA
MPELRWSLLALGVLFVVGLLLWERRRRGAGGDGLSGGRIEPDTAAGRRTRDEAADDGDDSGDAESDSDTGSGAAGIAADDVAQSAPRQAPFAGAGPMDRQPLRKPPLVEIVDPSVEGLDDGPDVVSLPVVSATGGPQLGAAAVERAAQWLAETQPSLQGEAPTPRPRLRLDWPEDSQRRILALRVVARTGERFTGGAVRQALQGEGFEFGEFDIFHLAIEDGRVELSAANLTKPGSFRLQKMDAESLLGLNLFAVLPGPRPALETFERLYGVAGLLAQRLRGEVRDATGQVLSGARLAELRREAAGSEAPRTGA